MQVHCLHSNPDVEIATDASGSWGCTAVWGKQWLQCQWKNDWTAESIALKELHPIVLAVAVWGPAWRHQQVLIQCDNVAVVQVINVQKCKDPLLLHLMLCLVDIGVKAKHIPGIHNTAADAISRNYLQVPFQQVQNGIPWISCMILALPWICSVVC